jgi:hypothetical protein
LPRSIVAQTQGFYSRMLCLISKYNSRTTSRNWWSKSSSSSLCMPKTVFWYKNLYDYWPY